MQGLIISPNKEFFKQGKSVNTEITGKSIGDLP